MLTPALVDYAFTLLGHALTHSLWARSGHLPFPEEDGEQFSKQQTLPLPTCHSPREESRWLLLPSPSSTVICLGRKTECTGQLAAEKRSQSMIWWGKESSYRIWSLCPAKIKYCVLWGLRKGK